MTEAPIRVLVAGLGNMGFPTQWPMPPIRASKLPVWSIVPLPYCRYSGFSCHPSVIFGSFGRAEAGSVFD